MKRQLIQSPMFTLDDNGQEFILLETIGSHDVVY
jgi:hypothetical protein